MTNWNIDEWPDAKKDRGIRDRLHYLAFTTFWDESPTMEVHARFVRAILLSSDDRLRSAEEIRRVVSRYSRDFVVSRRARKLRHKARKGAERVVYQEGREFGVVWVKNIEAYRKQIGVDGELVTVSDNAGNVSCHHITEVISIPYLVNPNGYQEEEEERED